MVKNYENIKGNIIDNSHLAAITSNGVWIKEKSGSNSNFIRSKNIDGDLLINVTIYDFDRENDLLERIEAKTADILNTPWIVYRCQNGIR